MLHVPITVDTEYSAGFYARVPDPDHQDNFDRSIWGATQRGTVGVGYQMDVLDAHGLKAVFFVDPLPGLIWGPEAVDAVVQPIVRRGHDVQLHLHTEWLQFLDHGPFAALEGRNIRDFTLAEQIDLIGTARDLLVQAGAPMPVAFRAGNYGANDDTLRALAALGLRYDTSFCPGIGDSDCEIALPLDQHAAVERNGVIEVPIGSIALPNGAQRHAQLTALTAREMTAAITHARDEGETHFTLVAHSFELMSRDRRRVNRIVTRRFETLCRWLAETPGVTTGTYAETPPSPRPDATPTLLPHDPLRSAERLAEQAVSNMLWGGD